MKRTIQYMLAAALLAGVLSGCAADAAPQAQEAAGEPMQPVMAAHAPDPVRHTDAAGRYVEEYTSDPAHYMGAKSLSGEWAESATVLGSTSGERRDWQIAWLEAVYESRGERFVVEEGIDASEITDMTGPADLFGRSPLYRELVSGSGVVIATGASFGKVTDAEHNPVVERYVFYADAHREFTLDVQCAMSLGTLALYVVSPEGEFLCELEAADELNETVVLTLAPGLHSVVLEYHMVDGNAKGEKSIAGTLV